jgi:hypothetical protein
MVRHSLNYVSWKRRAEVVADLMRIYQPATADEAEQRHGEFEAKWDAEYLPIGQSGRRNWARLFLDVPRVGTTIRCDTPLGTVESRKAVSDMIAPVDGTVLEINARLRNEPTQINSDPYGEGWALRIRLTRPDDIGHLKDTDLIRRNS